MSQTLDLLRETAFGRADAVRLVVMHDMPFDLPSRTAPEDDVRRQIVEPLERKHGGPSGVVLWLFQEHLDVDRVARIAARPWTGERAQYVWMEDRNHLREASFRRLVGRLWEAAYLTQRDRIDELVHGAPSTWFVARHVGTPVVRPAARAPTRERAPIAVPVADATGVAVATRKPPIAVGTVPPVRAIVDGTGPLRFHVEHPDFAAWQGALGISGIFPGRPEPIRSFAERILGAALRLQMPMLLRGLEMQRPLRMRDVGEAAGCHESTVSRVIARAEIVHHGESMPAGELFSNALGDDGVQAEISGGQARVALLAAIAANPGASDEKLSTVLGTWGIPISRRTVAKYRGPDQLGVPNSQGGGRQDAMLTAAIERLAPTEWLRGLVARRVFGIQDEAEEGHQVQIAPESVPPPAVPFAGEATAGVTPAAAAPIATAGNGMALTSAVTHVLSPTIDLFALQQHTEDEDDLDDELPGEPLAPWRTQVRFRFSPTGELPEGLRRSSGELFEHQERAMLALRAWWSDRGARGVLCLPTGAGKTRTAVSFLVEQALASSARVLWLAHRVELIDQAISTFASVSGRARAPFSIGRYQAGGMRVVQPTDVVVASIPTLARSTRGTLRTLDRLWQQQQGFDVVVVDECHHGAARSWRALVEWVLAKAPATRILGLSATPTRSQRGEAAALWKLFQRVIHEEPVPPLIEAGVLARPHVVVVSTERTFEANAYERAQFAKFDELPPSLVKRISEDAVRQQAVVRTWRDRRDEWGATLIFAATVVQGADLANRLRETGARSVMVSGATDDADRRAAVERFRRGDINVLVNCGLFTEGTDLPGVSTVFLARPTRSRILFQQMVGRAMRGPKVGGSPDCNVVAFNDSVTGLMSDMLASTFASEQEALSALGLANVTEVSVDEETETAPELDEPQPETFDTEALAQLLRELIGDWSQERAAREPLLGWWEAAIGRRRRFLPIFEVDREAAAAWVPQLRADTPRPLERPALARVSPDVVTAFGELASKSSAEVRFVLLKELTAAELAATLAAITTVEAPRPERVSVRGLHQTHVMTTVDYELLVRAWVAVGALLKDDADGAATADFIVYLRGLGSCAASDLTIFDLVAAAVRTGHLPDAERADAFTELELALTRTESPEWLDVARRFAEQEHMSTTDVLLDLLARSLERGPRKAP
ncbi:MAG: DEAD/DEAH box helicase family protein [Sandaracinus sp.]